VQINGNDVVALINSGATCDMLPPLFANLVGISTDLSDPIVSVTIADGTEHSCAGTAMAVPLRMGEKGRTIKVTEDFFFPEMALTSSMVSEVAALVQLGILNINCDFDQSRICAN
jgi:hypothetical protein